MRPPLIFLAEEAEHESQALLEEQLVDGRDWLMDTETSSLADLSVHYVWEWMLEFRPLRHLLLCCMCIITLYPSTEPMPFLFHLVS